MPLKLSKLAEFVNQYIHSERHIGIPLDALQVRLEPARYPDVPKDCVDDMIASGQWPSREHMGTSIIIDLYAVESHGGHRAMASVCALDVGLTSRDELVGKIKETLAPYKIKVVAQGF